MAKTSIPNSPTLYDTQSAAVEIGCSIGTLRKYVRRGEVLPQRTPSGHFIFFDRQIEQARDIYERYKTRG